MALNNMGLGFLFSAKDMASGVMRKVQGNFNAVASASTRGMASMQAAFAAIGPAIATMGAGLGVLAAGFAAADQFAKFEQGIAAVQAVTKATTEEVDKLTEAAIQAGIQTQFSPDEATEGLLSLATAGQTAVQATKTLIPVLNLAAGSLGQLGVAEAAEAVVGTLNAYGKSAEEATAVTDSLLRVTQLTNFQTRDFSIGLSKAAAAGATFGQGLDDILISMGLLRNRNIEASSSATALRESLRRIGADKRSQEAIKKHGVEIFNASGEMRSIIDITTDFAAATADLTAEERNASVVRAYGARGLLAFNAIQKAAFTETKDGISTTYQGAEAIDRLRAAMGEAGGTAEAFKKKLLSTYQGQKTLLRGTIQTLGVVAGEGFAATLAPVVSAVTTGLNMLIKVVKATPTPIKQLIGGLAGFVGIFLAGSGATILLGATVALLIPALKIIAVTFGVVLVALLPLIAAIGSAVLLFAALREAYDQNISGLGESTKSIFGQIKLAFDATSQLFKQGGFSGAVREEMQKAENQGIRAFAIGIYVWAERIKNFFRGILAGWKQGVGDLAPAFETLVDELRILWETVSRLFGSEETDPTSNQQKWDQWGSTGAKVGMAVAKVAGVLVKGLTLLIRFTHRVAFMWDSVAAIFRGRAGPALDNLGEKLRDLAEALGLLSGKQGDTLTSSDQMASGIATAAKVIAEAVTLIVTLVSFSFGMVATAFRFLKRIGKGIVDIVVGLVSAVYYLLTGQWAKAWESAKRIVLGAATIIMGVLEALAGGIASLVDTVASIAGKDLGLSRQVKEQFAKIPGFAESPLPAMTAREAAKADVARAEEEKAAQIESAAMLREMTQQLGGLEALTARPAIAEAEARREDLSGLERQLEQMSREIGGLSKQPIHSVVQVNLDEETIGEAVAKANRKRGALEWDPGVGAEM